MSPDRTSVEAYRGLCGRLPEAMPAPVQFSVINGMVAEDFDGDGNLDLLISGNDYGTEVSTGRYDALNGLYLKGNGKGDFSPQSILQSGIYIPGNAKALVALRSAGDKCLLAASQNRGPLKIFELKRNIQSVPFLPSDLTATIKYKLGSSRKQEVYFGSSFLSQSARFIPITGEVISVEITDVQGKKRMAVPPGKSGQ